MDSETYWKEREAEAQNHYIDDESLYLDHIEAIYDDMIEQCQREIDSFYRKYAKAEGMTMAEAKQKITATDIRAYERKAEKYVAEKNFSQQANDEMRLYNATMKINRLELLKANLGLELVSGHDELQKYYDKILTERTMQEFERQSGILGNSVISNEKTAHAIVNASYQNATFSDRIWMYQGMMKAELGSLLTQGLIQGKNPRKLAPELVKRFGVTKSDAVRLMRTELARVQIEAAKQSIERNGYEQYQFHALGTACDICKELDQKHFNVKDMTIAKNAPPMHPNCRCSISAYMDRAEFEQWLEDNGYADGEEDNIITVGKDGKLVYKESKSIKEAENFAKACGIEKCSYKGLALETANDMNKSLVNALNKCPQIKERMKFYGSAQERNRMLKADLLPEAKKWVRDRIGSFGYSEKVIEQQAKKVVNRFVKSVPSNVYAMAYNRINEIDSMSTIYNGYTGISVNKKYGSDYKEFSDSLVLGVKLKFHPEGTENVSSVFDHEFGHQIDYAYGLRDNAEIKQIYNSMNNKEIKENLSQYATTNINEFIAEAYSEYVNNESPRDIAKKIGEIIEKEITK